MSFLIAISALGMLIAAEMASLLAKNAATLREDLALIQAGVIKFTVHGALVNDEQAARWQANLARLDQVIDALGKE